MFDIYNKEKKQQINKKKLSDDDVKIQETTLNDILDRGFKLTIDQIKILLPDLFLSSNNINECKNIKKL